MSHPAYGEYKDSGVEWLGKVPVHWDVSPCRAIVTERNDRNDNGECEDYLSLMANVGIIPYAEKGDIGNKKPEDLSKCKVVYAGDFVINSMNYYIGSYGLSSYDGVCSPVYIVLTPRNDIVESGFAFRIFENKRFQKYAQSFGNGILEHRMSINWDILKCIGVPIPPVDEQTAILTFLDVETSKIDVLVSEQRRLIGLLKEKREAVISYTVTKGLNPAAAMKPTGIQWLGAVPEHWEVKRLRYVGRVQNGLNIGGEAFGSGDPFVSYGDVYNNLNVPEIPTGLVRSTQEDQVKYRLQIGDVLFTRTSETVDDIGVASTCLSSIPRSTFAGFLIRFRPNIGILDPQYSTYLFRNQGVQGHFSGTMNMVTRASLSQDVLKMLPICVPPLEEQREIAAFTSEKVELLRGLIAEAERAIDLLQERRTALISAAVTGKIDVRDFVLRKTA